MVHMIVITPLYWFWHFCNLLLFYLTSVFYIPEDGHMVGRNM
jgi:hypothetical protein